MIQSLKMRCANRPRARLPGNLAALEAALDEECGAPASAQAPTRSQSAPRSAVVRAALTSQIDRQQKLASQPKQGRSSEGS